MRLGFETDVKLANDGEWRDFPELQPKLRIKLRSSNSKAYQNLQATREREARGLERMGPVRQARTRAMIVRECVAEACILDWEGFFDHSTAPPTEIPYTPELARKLMTEPEYEVFYESVVTVVRQIGRNEQQLEENDLQD